MNKLRGDNNITIAIMRTSWTYMWLFIETVSFDWNLWNNNVKRIINSENEEQFEHVFQRHSTRNNVVPMDNETRTSMYCNCKTKKRHIVTSGNDKCLIIERLRCTLFPTWRESSARVICSHVEKSTRATCCSRRNLEFYAKFAVKLRVTSEITCILTSLITRVVRKRTLPHCVQMQIPELGAIGGVYTSPRISAKPMASVRAVGRFPGLGVPSETSFAKEPAQEAL